MMQTCPPVLMMIPLVICEGVNRVWRWFIRRRLCGAQLPSFIYWCRRHTRSSVKVKRDVGRIGGWGGGVESNLPSRRGWKRSYFNFNAGGCNFILRPTLLILDNYCTVPNPKICFSLKLIFAAVRNALQPFFPPCNRSCHFIGLKTCEKPSIFCSRPRQKGSGSTPDLTSQSTLHACLQRVNAT